MNGKRRRRKKLIDVKWFTKDRIKRMLLVIKLEKILLICKLNNAMALLKEQKWCLKHLKVEYFQG